MSSIGGARSSVPSSARLRPAIQRAAKLTRKVTTKSTRPVAISSDCRSGVASLKFKAMLAAIVGGLAVPITLSVISGVVASTIATAIVSPRARPRPSITPETMPERA